MRSGSRSIALHGVVLLLAVLALAGCGRRNRTATLTEAPRAAGAAAARALEQDLSTLRFTSRNPRADVDPASVNAS